MTHSLKSLLLSLLVAAPLAAAEPEFSDVFISGKEGYASIRIPAVIATRSGSVLAFAEGRQRPTDQAENDIVMKRSTDGGRSWSPLRVLHDDGAHSLNNPTVVQDHRSGRIFLWYQRIPAHLKEHSTNTGTGLDGPDIYRNFILTSDDDGLTWAAPEDVTRTTKRPERTTTIASGPGTGLQLSRGPHKDRLIIPFNEAPLAGGKTMRSSVTTAAGPGPAATTCREPSCRMAKAGNAVRSMRSRWRNCRMVP